MSITVFSPNMLKIYNECPAKFYYRYIEQIQTPILDKNFVTGKNIHALGAYYLKKQDISKLELNLTEKEREYWQTLKNNKYYSYEIVGVEKNISCKIGDYWFGGRLDAIVKNLSDYYILDYKTGNIRDEMTYDYQTMVYLMLCDEYFKDYNSLTFVYLDIKNKREIKTIFSNSLKMEYTSRLNTVIHDIMKFDINKFKKCENCNCEYSKICNCF